MERDTPGNPLPTQPRPRPVITSETTRVPSRPISPPTLSTRRHPGPPLVPTVISPLSRAAAAAALHRGGVPNADCEPRKLFIIGRTAPISPSPACLPRPSRPHHPTPNPKPNPPSGYPPLLRSARPPPPPPPPPPQGSNPRASPSPPPAAFLPEVPARPPSSAYLFRRVIASAARSFCRGRPSGARQIRAPHADPRHRR